MIVEYEMMIVLTENFKENELKNWSFNYAKTLRKSNASNISVISRGKRNLSYEIKSQNRGNFIQINFSSIPKYIDSFSSSLKFDSSVLRFLVINRTKNVKNF